eukprot:TRINITY_DN28495_c0_g1_i1.p1 TRINITY_DN28495_c0_g1~~TRINITY_DN28495_c0_g1_i1.p1  ORF type:complete len:657 (+),score=116.01 TRINITY_DN28495_c0_g1_i1:71-1972(+)
MEVSVDGLTATVAGGKRLLQQLSWKVMPGEMVALMGPSGAGKTTLLNCLVGRSNVGQVDGSVTYDGKELSKVRSGIGYVTQDDIMYETLTPRENLSFTACLMLTNASATERESAVQQVIEKLNLVKCADTVVGSPGLVKGISGGERKRTNVALSMLGKPSLLLLDEPTSGLDSKMAAELMGDVKQIAQRGCTVIATIHQPSEAVFQRFDKVLLLLAGKIAYSGPVAGLRQKIQSLDVTCEDGVPVPELLLDVLEPPSSKESKDEQTYQNRLMQLKAMGETLTLQPLVSSPSSAPAEAAKRANFLSQLAVLVRREVLSLRRNKNLTVVRAAQSVASSVLIGWIFFQLERNRSGIQTRLFSSFLLVFMQFMFALLSVVNTFPAERAVFLREAQDKLYHPAAFYLSKVAIDTLMQCFFPALVVAVSYPMVGLNSETADRVLLFYAIMAVVSNCGSAMGFMVSAAVSSVSTALAIAPGLTLPQMLLCGIFITVDKLPQPFNALSHLMVARYAVQATITNEFTCNTSSECDMTWRIGKHDQCDLSPCDFCCTSDEVASSGGVCPVLSCEDALKFLGMDEVWPNGNTRNETVLYNLLALLCLLVLFRLQGLNILMMSYRRAAGTLHFPRCLNRVRKETE